MQDDDERIFEDRTNDNNTNTTKGNKPEDAAYDLTIDSLTNPVPIQQDNRKKGFFERIEGGLFSLMRGKKKPAQEPYAGTSPRTILTREPEHAKEPEPEVQNVEDLFEAPPSQPEQDSIGQVAPKIGKARFDPAGISAKIFSRAIYLILLCSGVFMISSELPTHPALVIGLILVAVGANILSKE